tara:strand:- start:3688 stop:4440 length:753 start_codon:yes stop_codon:yes gene_type:complete
MKSLFIHALLLFGLAQVSLAQHIVFLIGEREYKTAESLPAYFESDLKPAGFTATFITAPPEGEAKNDFPGLEEALAKADLCLVSVRRRAPKSSQMAALKAFANAGKPIVGIRTSSHAFHLGGKEVPEGHALWEEFDPVVLGGNYHGHYGNEPAPISIAKGAGSHPILADIGELAPTSKLYRAAPLAEKAQALLFATVEGKEPEPVAWTHTFGPNNARIFYTSLGLADEFANPEFRKFLTQAILWALNDPA